ncbi:hypothetical protein BGZ94_000053 [Podila epigama]|nr:hypothetical protein BGZ94_000053 [Podila epigama]
MNTKIGHRHHGGIPPSTVPNISTNATELDSIESQGSQNIISNHDKVLVYQYSTLTPTRPPVLIKTLVDPRNDSDHNVVNAIKVGNLGSEEIVATVDHMGNVCVWFTANLQRDPFLLTASESAWGLAIHAERRMIAVSTNAFLIEVFHFGVDSSSTTGPRSVTTLTPTDHHTTSQRPSSHSATTTSESHQILRGHGHNIPNVAFSPCGQFLASASIDGTCRTWHIASGKEIQRANFGPLWGWGVSFVEADAWTSLSRSDYKAIPKSHLRPGQLPGRNVRDNPMSGQPFRPRGIPAHRLLRMIRSRWFAGPLVNTSCDEESSDGSSDNDNSEEDDDPGESDDDSEAGSYEDYDEENYRQADMSTTSVESLSGPKEFTLDSDDEDSIHSADNSDPMSGANYTSTTTMNAGEGSSRALERNHNHNHPEEVDAFTRESVSHDVTDGLASETRTATTNHAPERFITLPEEARPLKPEEERNHPTPGAGSDQPYPKQLLLCATARNIYLLSRHPYANDTEKNVNGALVESSATRRVIRSSHAGTSSHDQQGDDEHGDEGQDYDDGDDDDDDDDGQDDTFEDFVRNDSGDEDSEGLYDQDDTMLDAVDDDDAMGSPAVYYEDENAIWLLPPEEELDEEIDSELDDDFYSGVEDMDGLSAGEEEEDEDEDEDEAHASGSSPPEMHQLSVARGAVTRADGRGLAHLGHFDRIFFMEVVPEFGLLVAASQKGGVTLFRLLSVLDSPSSQAEATSDPEKSGQQSVSTSATTRLLSPSTENHLTEQGSKFVLFPETYLPRQEPPLAPLVGVSMARIANRETLSAVILHLLYLDNTMHSYELRIRNEKEDPVSVSNLFV